MQPTIPAAGHVRPLDRALAQARNNGIPDRAVAECAGLSTALLSRIQRGHIPATDEAAQRIAYALGMTVGELFPDRPLGGY